MALIKPYHNHNPTPLEIVKVTFLGKGSNKLQFNVFLHISERPELTTVFIFMDIDQNDPILNTYIHYWMEESPSFIIDHRLSCFTGFKGRKSDSISIVYINPKSYGELLGHIGEAAI